MTVVVHSFVADSSLIDCCDLVGFVCLFLLGVFFHLAPLVNDTCYLPLVNCMTGVMSNWLI